MELNQTKIHVVVEHSDSEDEMFIGTIDTDAKEKVKQWKVDLKINSRKATFKIDMGAVYCDAPLIVQTSHKGKSTEINYQANILLWA